MCAQRTSRNMSRVVRGGGKAYLTYTTDTNISAAVQMCALNDSLEERVNGDGDKYMVR